MDLETPNTTTPDTTPAPGSATTPDSPSSGALSEAFASLAAQMTGQMRTPEPVAPPEPEVTPAPAVEQPRDESGRFLPKEDADLDPAPQAEATPAPAPAAPEDAGEAEVDPDLVVELLPRWANGEPKQIALDSKETADLLRQTLKGAMRREEFEQAVAEVRQREEQAEMQVAQLIIDPVRTVQETLTPEQTDLLLLTLLTDDTIYQRVSERLPDLLDDTGRKLLRADVREQYVDQRDTARQQLEQRRQVNRNLKETVTALEAIVPEHLTNAQRDIFLRDAKRELSVVCRKHNIRLLDPLQIPAALQERLTAYGVDPQQAAETIAATLYGRGKPSAAAATRAAAAPALASASPRATATPRTGARTVTELRASHSRREAAAATAGAGVGTPAAANLPALPAGGGLSEAFALFGRGK